MQHLWTVANVYLRNAQMIISNHIVLRPFRKPTASLSSCPSHQLPAFLVLFLIHLADFSKVLPWGCKLLRGSCCRDYPRNKKFFLELSTSPLGTASFLNTAKLLLRLGS